MQSRIVQSMSTMFRNAARLSAMLILMAGVMLSAPQLFGQQVNPQTASCDIGGTWYGGSVVAYQVTIVPVLPPGHYTVLVQGMLNDYVMKTTYTGEIVKRGNLYEGYNFQLSTSDPDFLKPPPVGKMPDMAALWVTMELVDCNTSKSTIPFFGIYLASSIWEPGIIWVTPGKVPLIDPPDVDLLNVINGGKPIVETYHKVSKRINPDLLHKN